MNPGLTSTLLILCMTAFIGLMLGHLEFKKIKLGIAGVLFSGLLIAHLGFPVDEHTLHFLRDFGLILFVYSIGVDMGPRFFSSFKKDGLTLNMLAASIVILGFVVAYIIMRVTNTSPAIIVGIMCGAVTNTPSLGAAQQLLTEQGGELAGQAASTGMAYAVAYPFGILGIIITMILIRLVFRINVNKEIDRYNTSMGGSETKLQSVDISVTNLNVIGKKVSELKQMVDKELALSRIFRDGDYIIATDDEIIKQGDLLLGASQQQHIDILEFKIGKVSITERKEITGMLTSANILLTNRKLAGKTIDQIGIYRRYPANVTRVYRSGIEILPTMTTTLELGDTVKVVGKKEIIDDVKSELGNSVKELAKPNIVSVFIGVFLGIILGSIPIFIPGIPAPAKLGLAGGPLLISILLGYKGRVGKLSFYMTPGANLLMKELGIILFLSCVGLLSGGKFVETILNGGVNWLLYGALITIIPLLIVGLVGGIMKINYLKVCGCISGAMTDPPALEFANGIAPVPIQSTAYATVYPLTMFLRILLTQVFILLTL
ncbi:MAG: putative transporter [Paludibacteraceae bacterium]